MQDAHIKLFLHIIKTNTPHKVCSRCKVEKSRVDFYVNKANNKLSNCCKVCQISKTNTYLQKEENQEKIRALREKHKKLQHNAHVKLYYKQPEVKKARNSVCCKKYAEKNRERELERKKNYARDPKNKIRMYESLLKWQDNNKDKLNKKARAHYYKVKDTEEYKKKIRDYNNNRRKTDGLFKLKHDLRKALRDALRKKGASKKSKTSEIVGIPFEKLKDYLEYTYFLNYGEEYNGQPVEIDHIIPQSFGSSEEEIYKLNHWSNLQYLTPEDNLLKSNKYCI